MDNEQRLHGLYLHNYGGTICPTVWRAQVNHIDPRPVWRQCKTITLGKERYVLSQHYFRNTTKVASEVSDARAREAFSFELSYHADETETIATWLGEILTAQGVGQNISQPTDCTSRSFRFPEPPVRFSGGQDNVLASIFRQHGYLWTHTAEVAYDTALERKAACDVALKRKAAREALRAQYREERKRPKKIIFDILYFWYILVYC